MMIARLNLLKSLPRLASMAPFLCLIVAQCECPDMAPPRWCALRFCLGLLVPTLASVYQTFWNWSRLRAISFPRRDAFFQLTDGHAPFLPSWPRIALSTFPGDIG